MAGQLTYAQIDRIDAAVSESGWEVVSAGGHRPRRLLARAPGSRATLPLIIYIWRIRPGGGGEGVRPADERRVQQTRPGDADLVTEPGATTLLLGYEPDQDLYAAWDFELRRWTRQPPGHPGGAPVQSPSLQTRQPKLDEAQLTGIAFYAHDTDARQRNGTTVEQEELVANFRPDHFGDYLGWLAPTTLPPGRSPSAKAAKRRRVVTERLERDARFSKHVIAAYGQRCAFCGFGAGVVEAAHIQPVSEGGPDIVTNGIAVCPTHHKLFDKGYVLIDPTTLAISINEPLTKKRKLAAADRRRIADELGSSPHWPTPAHLRPDPRFIRYQRKLNAG